MNREMGGITTRYLQASGHSELLFVQAMEISDACASNTLIILKQTKHSEMTKIYFYFYGHPYNSDGI